MRVDKSVWLPYTNCMMNIYDNKKTISNLILGISKKISQIEGKTRNYGTDQPIFGSEVHIIKSIMENEGIHITALAEMLNVTKGTISEVIIKLQKKGMVVKEPDSNNLSRMCLKLTEKGKKAYINHEALHKRFEDAIKNIIKEEPEENKQFLFQFFSDLDSTLTEFIE